jgi:transcription-repair coupling factor (superfamily II helicase)
MAGHAIESDDATGGLRAALERLTDVPTAPRGRITARVVGAEGALGPAVAAHLLRGVPGPLLYVVPDEETVATRLAELTLFGEGLAGPGAIGDAIVEYPAIEISPYAEVQPDRRTVMKRLGVLYRLATGGKLAPRVLVAPAAAVFRRVLTPEALRGLASTVTSGSTITRDELVARLERAGYSRTPLVEDPGTFAVRGAVVDLFPAIYEQPVRLELFGDEIDSLRLYDPATQRTTTTLDEVHIHPVRETLLTEGGDPRARLLDAADASSHPSSRTRQLIANIEEGLEFFGIEALTPVFHGRMAHFFDYMPVGALVVVQDLDAVVDQSRRTLSKLRTAAERRRAEHRLALPPEEFFLDEEQSRQALLATSPVCLDTLEVMGAPDPGPVVRMAMESNISLRGELLKSRLRGAPDEEGEIGPALKARIEQWRRDGMRVRIVAPNPHHAERMTAVLSALSLAPVAAYKDAGKKGHAALLGRWLDPRGPTLAIDAGPLARGFRVPADRLVVVSEEDIFGPRVHRAPPRHAAAIGDLEPLGDNELVVHDEHGVGRYRGLKKLAVHGVTQDFLQLEYDGGTVYVPVYRVGLVSRFVGAADGAVRLDKLGGKTWLDKKRRASGEARKIAEELLQLYAQRKALPGHAFPPPDALFREFEETFAFDETPDQARAIEAVLGDMQGPSPMDRLICGDVGYGKTEVALRATLLAVLGGKQVAVLAPTTVLAEQHFLTFSERFTDFPVRVGSLSRFRDKREQARTIAELTAGKLDVVIGTHRLLSRDVRFRQLGLIVVDEEQRFGVTHKERLKEMRTQVDVLTLTATPIPRTMQMAMGGLKEISIIATPPADRLAIRTFVCRFDEALLGEALERELGRGGQAFFVHNRVDDLPAWMERVQALAPKARVAMAHGQMAEGALEKAMVDFVDGRFDILCCTTIIESGLDISRANTMIVNRADHFGLSQLYQLRGRIGRARERAYCYLVLPEETGKGTAISPQARQRLAVLQRFTELGAGFQVASHDLEIRGAGELLGERQSGSMAAVGFDTYARILEEAAAELRGEPIKRPFDPEIAVDVPAFLPDDYVPEAGQRLDFYQRLSRADEADDVQAIVEELTDRFGPPPENVTLLARIMVDKTILRRLGALAYELSGNRLIVTLGTDTRLDPGRVLRLCQARDSRYKLGPDMRLSYLFDDGERQDHLEAARARLLEIETCIV